MQLLEHFKDLTLHPKNAEELKGLILQLAIQGKLTAQWRRDNMDAEYASVLIERIKTEKRNLIKAKKIKKEKSLSEITKDDFPFELPLSWVWCRLGDACQIGSSKRIYEADYVPNGIPFYRSKEIGDFSRGEMAKSKLFISLEKYKDLSINYRVPQKGDLLITSVGSIGNTWIADEREFYYKDGNITQINRSDYIDSTYLQIFIKSPQFMDEVLGKVSGTAYSALTIVKLKSLMFMLPPLEEQKAIVATVNQLFAEVEQLEDLTKKRIKLKEDFVTSALRQLSTNDTNSAWAFLQPHFKSFFTEKSSVKKLRESILQLAVQGKLTKHWRTENPNKENASVLLERIKVEKEALIKAKAIKKEKALPDISEEEIPYNLPKGWEWSRLGTVTDIIAGASFKSGDFNEIGGAKCIKITNAGVREFVETNDYLPESFIEKYPNSLIKSGDLVLALTRPYIKAGLKISTCPGSYDNSLLNQRVAAIRSMTEELHHPYVFSFIQSPHVLNYYKSKFDGKSQQPNMKMGDITDLLFAVPPLEEQQAIVEKVNALMALCDSLEKEIETHQTTQEHWMQSCLKEVFETGEELEDEEILDDREPNLECSSCHYKAYSDCLGFRGMYCAPAVCKLCNNIYDINTEFVGEPEEINKCNHCGGYDYEEWDQEMMTCPKCNQRMEVLKLYE